MSKNSEHDSMPTKSKIARHHLLTLGPPFVGKGLSGIKVKEVWESSEHGLFCVTNGDLVRDRLKTDEAFAAVCAEAERSGELIPDEYMLPMTRAEYSRGVVRREVNFYCDGFDRTDVQVREKIKWGITPDNTTVLILEATLARCLHNKAIGDAAKLRANRNDNSKATERYRLYDRHRSSVLRALRESGFHPVLINADCDVEQVADKVVAYARRIFTDPSPPDVRHNLDPRKRHFQWGQEWSNFRGLQGNPSF